MTEIIKSIDHYKSYGEEGFCIVTSKQKILLLINSSIDCCEKIGYTTSDDSFADFIGAELKGVFIVDEGCAKTLVNVPDLELGGIVFVNLETSKGTLQFAIYNGHNGYYGHKVRIISTQITENFDV